MNYDKNKIKFQTYSWVIGTTSFRVSETKYKIEKQLLILSDFQESITNSSWKEQQEEYFYSLVDNGLAKYKSDIKKAEKEGRQISSSLEYLGLINKDRILQNTAYELLEILNKKKFNYNNIFGVRNDSFFYIKQFLKLEFSENIANGSYKDFKIQPYLATIYTLLKHKNKLPIDFFTYILPTIKTYEELQDIIDNPISNIDNFLLIKISSMENYQNALNYFIQTEKNETIFKVDNIFMNMNGGKNDLKFLYFYNSLLNYNRNWSFDDKKEFILNIQFPITGKNKFLYQLIFNRDTKPTINQIEKDLINNFENSFLFKYSSCFDKNFFYLIHLSKWKINLEEYYDLNKRFLGLTDIFIFSADYVSLDEVAFSIFNQIGIDILNINFSTSQEEYFNNLYSQLNLIDISNKFNFDEYQLLQELKAKYPEINTNLNLIEEINKIKSIYLKNDFDSLIDSYFNAENIKELFKYIQIRDDKKILNYKNIGWDSDVPTIFEYLIGVFWYQVSGRKGNLIEFLNLSLDSKLLPRRFAGGGKADIVYKYDDHHILLEATLSDKNTQRKMELEPVSRHLGKYKIENGESHYAVFIAPYLDPNVLVSFRSYKNLNYYNPSNTKQFTQGLKIIPLDIDDLITIIDNQLTYEDISIIFNKSFYNNQFNGFNWYYKVLKPELSNKIINKEIQIYKNLCDEVFSLLNNNEIRLLTWYKKDKNDKTLKSRNELHEFIDILRPVYYPSVRINKLPNDKFHEYIKNRNFQFKPFKDENKKLLFIKRFLQKLVFDIKQLEIEDLLCIEESINIKLYERIIDINTNELKNFLGYRNE